MNGMHGFWGGCSGYSNIKNIDLMSPPKTTPTKARKRRRGLSITLLLHYIIEKWRRDRNSLTDLRRLVPCAFEKQVGYSTIDCYFTTHVLGWNNVDPLRVRLVSHLNYASRRDIHTGLTGHPGQLAWGSALRTPSAHLPHPLLPLPQGRTLAPHSTSSPPSSKLKTTTPLLPVCLLLHYFPRVSPVALNSAGSSTALRNQPYRPWGTDRGLLNACDHQNRKATT
uniref:Uncharacterized protein n=1 Tax=Oncorhynchus tshawytscha TaxID=74940 RepID=A0A8C8FJG3_ONCTS